MKVVIGASSFADKSDKAINLLLERGIEVVKNPYGRKMDENEIIDHLQGADGLLAGLEPLNDTVFKKAPTLRAIARIGIGMDNVDTEAAQKRDIKVSNTPDGPTQAVAEMTLAALLSIARGIIPANTKLHNGIWEKKIGFSLCGIKVLIIGYGRIGRRVAELLQNFGVQIIVYDEFSPENCTADLISCLKETDVITLHASGDTEILTKEMFSHMKKDVVILNSARGGLINEDALYNALCDGTVSGFWGDVFWKEPYDGRLCTLENAILTPHISTYSKQCRENMETDAVMNLLRDLGIDKGENNV